MFQQIKNFHSEFLLPVPQEDGRRQRRTLSGQYHHVQMLSGESESEIVRQIIAMGGTPVRVKEMRPKPRILSGVSKEYRKQFLMAVHFNCEAMSATKALEAVIENDTGPVRARLNQGLQILRRGGSFIEAIEALEFYDEGTLAILAAGERTGSISNAIKSSFEHLNSQAANSKLMIGMATFTGAELGFAVLSLLGNRYGFLPSIAKNLPENATPEQIESLRAAVDLAYVSNDLMIWGTIVVLIVSIAGVYSYFDKDKNFRKWVDDRVMRIPVLSAAILHGALSNSFRVAASLVAGGAHFDVAMQISRESTRVPRVIGYWNESIRRAENGDSVANALSQSVLDNSDRLLISSHNNRAQLALAFSIIAGRRDDLAKNAARKFGVVSFIATSIYTMLAVCVSMYVLYVQNSSMMTGLTAN